MNFNIGSFVVYLSAYYKYTGRLFCFHFSISNGCLPGLAFVLGVWRLGLSFEACKRQKVGQ